MTDYEGYCHYEKTCHRLPGYVLYTDKGCTERDTVLSHPLHHDLFTAEQCGQLCDTHKSCISFEYIEDGKKCYLSGSCAGDLITHVNDQCLYVKVPACPPEEVYVGSRCDFSGESFTFASTSSLIECQESAMLKNVNWFSYKDSTRECEIPGDNDSMQCNTNRVQEAGWTIYQPRDCNQLTWKKHEQQKCQLTRGSVMGTVEKAMEQCLKDTQCGGVSQSDCGGREVELCVRVPGATLKLDTLNSACFYEKPGYKFYARWVKKENGVLNIQKETITVETRATTYYGEEVEDETVETYRTEASYLREDTVEVNAGIEVDFISAGMAASTTTSEGRATAEEFTKALITSVQTSYETEVTQTLTIETPSAFETGIIDYSTWCFQVDATSPDGQTISTYTKCRQKWGCGREDPPNCLPDKCSHDDELSCAKCKDPMYELNVDFYNGNCDPYIRTSSLEAGGTCRKHQEVISQSNCARASNKMYGVFTDNLADPGHTCGCFVDQDGKRYWNLPHSDQPCEPQAGEDIICLNAPRCGGLFNYDQLTHLPESEWRCPDFDDFDVEMEVAAENARLKEVNRALKKTLKEFEN